MAIGTYRACEGFGIPYTRASRNAVGPRLTVPSAATAVATAESSSVKSAGGTGTLPESPALMESAAFMESSPESSLGYRSYTMGSKGAVVGHDAPRTVLYPWRMELSSGVKPTEGVRLKMPPRRIYDEYSMGSRFDKMVAHNEYSIVKMDMAVEVVEDEETVEKEPTEPERIRHPGIKVRVIGRRRIVRNDRRSVLIVIIVHNFWRRRTRLSTRQGPRSCATRLNRQTEAGQHSSNRSLGLVPAHRETICVGCCPDFTLNFSDDVRGHGIASYPSVIGFNAYRTQ